MDRWILSRLANTTATVTDALTAYDPLVAATALGDLVDDLSNWYVRRSRRRFWRTDPDAPAGDTLAAQATLHEVLTTLALLLAPMCPFVSDTMWRHLTGAAVDGDASVHLADWPVAETASVDADLEAQMALARRLTSLGRAARGEASVKVRQPLKRALVFLPAGSPEILRDIVADELNVDEVDTAEELSEVIQFELKPNFKTLGSRLKDLVREVEPALEALDTAAAAAALEEGRVDHGVAGRASRSSCPPTMWCCGSGASRVSPCPARAARSWPWTWTSTRGCASAGCPGTWCGCCRTCARRRGSRSPTASGVQVVGLDVIGEFFDFIAREVLAVEIVSGPGPGRGCRAGPRRRVVGRAGAGLDREGRPELTRCVGRVSREAHVRCRLELGRDSLSDHSSIGHV